MKHFLEEHKEKASVLSTKLKEEFDAKWCTEKKLWYVNSKKKFEQANEILSNYIEEERFYIYVDDTYEARTELKVKFDARWDSDKKTWYVYGKEKKEQVLEFMKNFSYDLKVKKVIDQNIWINDSIDGCNWQIERLKEANEELKSERISNLIIKKEERIKSIEERIKKHKEEQREIDINHFMTWHNPKNASYLREENEKLNSKRLEKHIQNLEAQLLKQQQESEKEAAQVQKTENVQVEQSITREVVTAVKEKTTDHKQGMEKFLKENDIKDSMPDYIITLRTALGLTQKQCAILLNVDVSTWHRWEKGISQIRIAEFERIVRILKSIKTQT